MVFVRDGVGAGVQVTALKAAGAVVRPVMAYDVSV